MSVSKNVANTPLTNNCISNNEKPNNSHGHRYHNSYNAPQ